MHRDKIVETINKKYSDDPEEFFEPGVNDGTFLMCYSNWRDIYNNMFIIYDFPDEFNAIRCEGAWVEGKNNGGTPNSNDPNDLKAWAKNPQILFAPKLDCDLFVSLDQPDGRAKRLDPATGKYVYYSYPY